MLDDYMYKLQQASDAQSSKAPFPFLIGCPLILTRKMQIFWRDG